MELLHRFVVFYFVSFLLLTLFPYLQYSLLFHMGFLDIYRLLCFTHLHIHTHTRMHKLLHYFTLYLCCHSGSAGNAAETMPSLIFTRNNKISHSYAKNNKPTTTQEREQILFRQSTAHTYTNADFTHTEKRESAVKSQEQQQRPKQSSVLHQQTNKQNTILVGIKRSQNDCAVCCSCCCC